MLEKISKTLEEEDDISDMSQFPDDYLCNYFGYFKYAPNTLVDVERTFSSYKILLSDNRRAFTFENLLKHFIIQCNNGGKAHKYKIIYLLIYVLNLIFNFSHHYIVEE